MQTRWSGLNEPLPAESVHVLRDPTSSSGAVEAMLETFRRSRVVGAHSVGGFERQENATDGYWLLCFAWMKGWFC